MNKRVHEEKCDFCGKLEHYAKGLCHNCYYRLKRRGTVEYYIHPTTSYYERNKDKILENAKQYRIKNKEYFKEYDKIYQKNNKEKISNYKKQWYLKNRERILKKYHENKLENEVNRL